MAKGWRRGNYTASHKETGDFLRSNQLATGTYGVANEIAAKARAMAPRSDNPDDGHYADGIEIERNNAAGVKGDRIGFEVVATEGHPTLVEWGRRPGKNHPGYEGQHVMRLAVEEVAR